MSSSTLSILSKRRPNVTFKRKQQKPPSNKQFAPVTWHLSIRPTPHTPPMVEVEAENYRAELTRRRNPTVTPQPSIDSIDSSWVYWYDRWPDNMFKRSPPIYYFDSERKQMQRRYQDWLEGVERDLREYQEELCQQNKDDIYVDSQEFLNE